MEDQREAVVTAIRANLFTREFCQRNNLPPHKLPAPEVLDNLAYWIAQAIPANVARENCPNSPHPCACMGACMHWTRRDPARDPDEGFIPENWLLVDREAQEALRAAYAETCQREAALRTELRNQWEFNHAEHCGQAPAVGHAGDCHWPRPAVLMPEHPCPTPPA